MSNNIFYKTNSGNVFIASENIRVYPTAFRGSITRTTDSSTTEIPIDPEARLQTEHNFSTIGGSAENKFNSYIIS